MAQPGSTLVTLARRWFEEVWNQKRVATINELLTDNVLAHGLVGPDGKEVRGPAAFKSFHQHFCTAFPDIHITVEDVLQDGDKVAARCSVTGTHRGSNLPVAATNNAINITGMCILRVEEGKIAEAWNNFDFLKMYQQIGMQLS